MGSSHNCIRGHFHQPCIRLSTHKFPCREIVFHRTYCAHRNHALLHISPASLARRGMGVRGNHHKHKLVLCVLPLSNTAHKLSYSYSSFHLFVGLWRVGGSALDTHSAAIIFAHHCAGAPDYRRYTHGVIHAAATNYFQLKFFSVFIRKPTKT